MARVTLTDKEIADFQKQIRRFFTTHGRTLPWRETQDAYHILVSEIMLQQTQVDRVVPKYTAFIERFPTVSHLSRATLQDVLTLWQGLGYNRRARMLHRCAQTVMEEHGGAIPSDATTLCALPGIGPYTAGAIRAFAYNEPSVMIETNIRTVYLHHFFAEEGGVSDTQVRDVIAQTLDHDAPRTWYWALMDYGAYIKKHAGNAGRRSKHYTKQSSFKDSNRYIRGRIVALLTHEAMSLRALYSDIAASPERIKEQCEALACEGMIERADRRWQIAR